jgi:hypothetical protein
MIIDGYVGAYPLLIVNGKQYAAGFGPLAEYWIRDYKDVSEEIEAANLRMKNNSDAYELHSEDDDAEEELVEISIAD